MSDDSTQPSSAPAAEHSAPPPRWLAQLQNFRHLAGAVPDRVLAEQAGVSVSVARQYRQRLGLPEVPVPRPIPEPKAPRAPRPEKVASAAVDPEGPEQAAPAPKAKKESAGRKAKATAKVKAPKPAPPAKLTTEQKLAPYAHLFGTLSASEIGNRAGVPPWAVVEFRKSLTGSPDVQAPLDAVTESVEPSVEAVTAPVAAPQPNTRGKRGPPSPIEPFRELLGKVPDGQVAALAGVTQSGVVKYRQRHGIAAAVGSAAPATRPARPEPAAKAREPQPKAQRQTAPEGRLFGWRLRLTIGATEAVRYVLAPDAITACRRGASLGEVVGAERDAEALG